MITIKKKLKLGESYLKSLLYPLPLWAHLFVTNHCNLSCDYCYQTDNRSPDPTLDEIKSWINHTRELGTAIIAFMGGEPTLRKDLPEIIDLVTDRNMISYLTTNGRFLTNKTLEALSHSGLDVIEISLDGYDSVKSSQKTLNGDEGLIDQLEQAHQEYGLKFKIHQVLSPDTVTETPKLLELSERRQIPISFGILYPFPSEKDLCFEFKRQLEAVVQLILDRSDSNPLIINPQKYFNHVLNSFRNPSRMKCDMGKYVIQVSTAGKVFRCSKLLEQTDKSFLEVDSEYFTLDQHHREQLFSKCSHECLSACAYLTTFYRENPLHLAALEMII